ncbi:hypothetical protein ACWGI0_35710 [Streptomyces sp. NPDC054802]
MKIIALEGPSHAGKSTVISHLRRRGIEKRAYVSDCYVKHIAHRDDIPPARTGSAAAQLFAFETFMGIENARVREALAGARPMVLLDRSVDTLLAHAHALDVLFGYDVHHQLRDRLQELPFLRPHHTLYLDVPAEVLNLRRKTAGHTAAESDYFLHEPPRPRRLRQACWPGSSRRTSSGWTSVASFSSLPIAPAMLWR